MKTKLLLIWLFGSIITIRTNAQTTFVADPEKWTNHNCKVTFNEGVIYVNNTSGKSALLWLKDFNFKNGTVELDIKGKDLKGESFVGIALHGLDNEHYDAVYFRPFNFKDPERKSRSVQYVAIPDYDWDALREKFPGKYENTVNPVPNPNDWFHARIVVKYPEIMVYVNDSKDASLIINQMSKRAQGKLGLWVDSKDGWFKNIVITQAN
jgi:hypothetical protein